MWLAAKFNGAPMPHLTWSTAILWLACSLCLRAQQRDEHREDMHVNVNR